MIARCAVEASDEADRVVGPLGAPKGDPSTEGAGYPQHLAIKNQRCEVEQSLANCVLVRRTFSQSSSAYTVRLRMAACKRWRE
jgi:hypothetical protein